MNKLRHRREFLACAKGRRFTTAAFVLQRNLRADEACARFGLTVTKKTGNAVQRNRIKRRLRAVISATALEAVPGRDYVLVGRPAALTQDFQNLRSDLQRSLHAVETSAAVPRKQQGASPSST